MAPEAGKKPQKRLGALVDSALVPISPIFEVSQFLSIFHGSHCNQKKKPGSAETLKSQFLQFAFMKMMKVDCQASGNPRACSRHSHDRHIA
jgi:hypothetical protein